MLAVPLLGDQVAPRFCSADEFMIAELNENRRCQVRLLAIPEQSWSRCLERLSIEGVKVLLCGGFNCSFLPTVKGLGIRVIAGLTGKVSDLIDAFLQDELARFEFLPCRMGRFLRRLQMLLRSMNSRRDKEDRNNYGDSHSAG